MINNILQQYLDVMMETMEIVVAEDVFKKS